MKNIFITVAIFASMLGGCASPPPKIATIPDIPTALPPTAPANENLSARLLYPSLPIDEVELEDNVTSRSNFKVGSDASVVISVPIEQQLKGQRRDLQNNIRGRSNYTTNQDIGQRDLNELDRLQQEEIDSDVSFRTAEYFNMAEQEIEKSLLRKNFRVLDRSKFEAKLRKQRTKTRDDNFSIAKNEEIKSLQEERDAKRITRDAFVEKLRDLESKYDVIQQSDNRQAGDNELVDISELIRAAQSAGVKAEYILQVNTFKIDAISDRYLDLVEMRKIEDLILKHPGLGDAMSEKGISSIVQPGYYGYLNAKLIHVESGEIVWVGEHRVDSTNVTDIRVDLKMSRQIVNEKQIDKAVTDHNAKIRHSTAQAHTIGQSTQIQGLDQAALEQRLASYRRELANLENLRNKGPVIPPWHYSYHVANPLIQPRFPSSFEINQLKRQSLKSQADQNRYIEVRDQLDRHHSELAKMVSKQLIQTIPSAI